MKKHMAFSITFLLAATIAFASGQTAQGGEEEQTFRVWWTSNATGLVIDSIKTMFEEEHPNVNVVLEEKSFSQVQESTRMVLNSDQAPQLLEANIGNSTMGQYAEDGLLQPMDQVAQERGWSDVISASISGRYTEEGQMDSNGTLYGIQTFGSVVLLYYNKSLLDELGLEPPRNLDEFENVARTMRDSGTTPLITAAGEKWPISHDWWELVLYRADEQFISNWYFLDEPVNWDHEALEFGTSKLKEYYDAGFYHPDITGYSESDAQLEFVSQNVGMWITGSWNYAAIIDADPDFEWGVMPMPDKRYSVASLSWAWSVPADSEQKELAYDWIDIAIDETIQTEMANKGGLALNASLDGVESEQSRELLSAWNSVLERDGLGLYPDWPIPSGWQIIGGALQELVLGEESVSDVIETMKKPYMEANWPEE